MGKDKLTKTQPDCTRSFCFGGRVFARGCYTGVDREWSMLLLLLLPLGVILWMDGWMDKH